MMQTYEPLANLAATIIVANPRKIKNEDILAVYNIFVDKITANSQIDSSQFINYRKEVERLTKILWPGARKFMLRPTNTDSLGIMHYGINETLFRPESKAFLNLELHDEFIDKFGRETINYFREKGIEGRLNLISRKD